MPAVRFRSTPHAARRPCAPTPVLTRRGGAAKIGPDLWGVVGRPVASTPGFAYSDSLKGLGGDWSYDRLNAWITNPKALAAGTKMAFAGEKEGQKRADILAYLQSLSDTPVPFPK